MRRIILAALFLIASPAVAHEWYPVACCSGIDCEPIPQDYIHETAAGWEISTFCSMFRPTVCAKGFVKRGDEQASMDGRYHLCFNSLKIICFFVPVMS